MECPRRIYHLDKGCRPAKEPSPQSHSLPHRMVDMISVIKFKRGAAQHIQSTILFPDRRNANLRPRVVMCDHHLVAGRTVPWRHYAINTNAGGRGWVDGPQDDDDKRVWTASSSRCLYCCSFLCLCRLLGFFSLGHRQPHTWPWVSSSACVCPRWTYAWLMLMM